MKRPPLIAANWKMHLTPTAGAAIAKKIVAGIPPHLVRIVLCPAYPALVSVASVLRRGVALGAQDVYAAERGAYTGAVSLEMLKDTGCRYVIIGHSERRSYFHETDRDIQKKFDAISFARLVPIVCVGETLSERRRGQSAAVVKRELRTALAHAKRFTGEVVIAYEPIWAIGGGSERAAQPALIQQMDGVIRATAKQLLSTRSFSKLSLLYGGSVTPSNVANYVGEGMMDGALVGGASLKAESFLGIIRAVI